MSDGRPDVEALVGAFRAARDAFWPIFRQSGSDPDYGRRPESVAFGEAVERLKAALAVVGPVVVNGQRYELHDLPDGHQSLVSSPDRTPSG